MATWKSSWSGAIKWSEAYKKGEKDNRLPQGKGSFFTQCVCAWYGCICVDESVWPKQTYPMSLHIFNRVELVFNISLAIWKWEYMLLFCYLACHGYLKTIDLIFFVKRRNFQHWIRFRGIKFPACEQNCLFRVSSLSFFFRHWQLVVGIM